MFDPQLEARLVAAVRSVLTTPMPDQDGAATHQLCEVARELLEAFLRLSDDWPEASFIDALAPLSVQHTYGRLELVAAAIVTNEEQATAWVQPLIAEFALDGDALADVSLLFAYADREPPVFVPEQEECSVELPADAEGFLYRLSTAPSDLPEG